MCPVNIYTPEILLIRCIEERKVFIKDRSIFFLKHLSVLRIYFVSIFIILSIIFYLINEEKRQAFDSLFEELLLFFEVRTDRFSNLNSTNILLTHISQDFTSMDFYSIRKGNQSLNRVNLIDVIALILLHFLGKSIKVVINTYDTSFSVYGFIITDFKFDSCHWRFLRRNNNILKIQVTICASQILDIKSFDLNLLNQFHPVGIKRIEDINEVMVFLMRCGIIQNKEWIKLFQGFLGLGSTHLLWFIQNNNRAVSLDNIYRLSTTKIIQFHTNSSCIFAPGIESLDIDDHY